MDRYNLVIRSIWVTAPTTMADADGQKLYEEIEKDLEQGFRELKEKIETKHPDLIVALGR